MSVVDDLPRPVGFVLGGGGSLGAAQVGMLRALTERGIVADLVVGTSVGALNGALVALDPSDAVDRLAPVWSAMTRRVVFPGGPLSQANTLRRGRTHLFPNTGLHAVIDAHLPRDATFADLAVPFGGDDGRDHRGGPRGAGRSAGPRPARERRHPGHLPGGHRREAANCTTGAWWRTSR